MVVAACPSHVVRTAVRPRTLIMARVPASSHPLPDMARYHPNHGLLGFSHQRPPKFPPNWRLGRHWGVGNVGQPWAPNVSAPYAVVKRNTRGRKGKRAKPRAGELGARILARVAENIRPRARIRVRVAEIYVRGRKSSLGSPKYTPEGENPR